MSEPFKRGEILTAAKLNAAIGNSRRLTVAGDGAVSNDADGDVVRVDGYENIYIRLTGKTGTNPIKYAWTEVFRNANGTWSNTTNNGTTTGDYAIELNNSNLSTSDNYVYRAERSPESGEWLFFLRRNTKCGYDGFCIRYPNSISFNGSSCSYSANIPIWDIEPDTVIYDGECPQYEYFDGWIKWYVNNNVNAGPTEHFQELLDYLECLETTGSQAGSLTLNTNVRSETDITNNITAFFPTPLVYDVYLGAIDANTSCRLLSDTYTTEYVIKKAIKYVEANLTGGGNCSGFTIDWKRGYDVQINIKQTRVQHPSNATTGPYYVDWEFGIRGFPDANGTYPEYTNNLTGQITGTTGGACDESGPFAYTYGNITVSY